MHKLERIVTDIIASLMNLESKWTDNVVNIIKDTKRRAVHNHDAPAQCLNN